jgi:hypothetical protein
MRDDVYTIHHRYRDIENRAYSYAILILRTNVSWLGEAININVVSIILVVVCPSKGSFFVISILAFLDTL